jgi:hypothetical protein
VHRHLLIVGRAQTLVTSPLWRSLLDLITRATHLAMRVLRPALICVHAGVGGSVLPESAAAAGRVSGDGRTSTVAASAPPAVVAIQQHQTASMMDDDDDLPVFDMGFG